MANEEHLALLRQGVKVWNEWRKTNLEIKPNLRGADLNRANLSEANLNGADLNRANLSEANLNGADLNRANLSRTILSGVNLSRVNLRGADLSRTNLSGKDLGGANLSGINLRGADLRKTNFRKANLSEANLSEANLSGVNLSRTNLSGLNLRKANLSGLNLSGLNLRKANLNRANLSRTILRGANLSRTNLSRTNLSRTQALKTNFEGAILTGACIEDWSINSQTNLNNVICDYIYLKEGERERRPPDHNRNFEPGEFTKLYQKTFETVDLFFSKGVDWKAVAYSIKNTQVLNEDTPLAIQSIENKGDGTVLIKVNVPKDADKGKIQGDFWQDYELAHKALEAQYQARIDDKEQEINRLFYLLNQSQEKLPQLMAEAKKEYNFHAPIGSVGNEGTQANVAGLVKGDQVDKQYNYAPEQKQTLAEAAAEIQQLLIQLQSQGYSPEDARQKTANDLATKAKDDPTTLGKLVKWGQSLGDAAAKTTVTEAAREVVKLALRLSGVPLP